MFRSLLPANNCHAEVISASFFGKAGEKFGKFGVGVLALLLPVARKDVFNEAEICLLALIGIDNSVRSQNQPLYIPPIIQAAEAMLECHICITIAKRSCQIEL